MMTRDEVLVKAPLEVVRDTFDQFEAQCVSLSWRARTQLIAC